MLFQLENTFGKKFWENAVLEITKYGFHEVQNEVRGDAPEKTEDGIRDDLNAYFRENFKLPVRFLFLLSYPLLLYIHFQNDLRLPTVFIDTHYTENDENSKKKFEEYTAKLWEIANRLHPYDITDVAAMQNELAKERQRINDLVEKLGICDDENAKQSKQVAGSSVKMAGLSVGMVALGVVLTAVVAFAVYKRQMKSGLNGLPPQNEEG